MRERRPENSIESIASTIEWKYFENELWYRNRRTCS